MPLTCRNAGDRLIFRWFSRNYDANQGALEARPVFFAIFLGEIEMGQHTIEFSDSNFEQEVLQSTDGVLVDFWAPWCGPCRQIAPLIDQLAEQFSGTIKVGKLNIDENPSVTGQYGIQSIPTLLLFKQGEVVERFVGMPPKAKLEEALTAAQA